MYKKLWSGRWESNPRHSAWEADVLPLNYARAPVSIDGAVAGLKGLGQYGRAGERQSMNQGDGQGPQGLAFGCLAAVLMAAAAAAALWVVFVWDVNQA